MFPAARVAAATLCLLVAAAPATAALYRWEDDRGVVNYTDEFWRFDAHRRRTGDDDGGPLPGTGASAPRPDDATTASPPAAAGPRGVDDPSAEMMRLSGLDGQVDLLAAMVRAEFARWRQVSRHAAAAAVVVEQTLGADALRRRMRAALAREMEPERAQAVLDWLRSPLSRRIVALEHAAAATGRAEHVAFVDRLPGAPPAPARIALALRLERAAEVTSGSALVWARAASALRRTLTPFMPPRMPARDAGEWSPIQAIDDGARLRVMTSLLFTYRDLSDADLARYVGMLESPAGRWFTRATRRAFVEALAVGDERGRPGAVTAAVAGRPR